MALILVLAGGIFLRFYRLGTQALWLDEVCSVTFASETDLGELVGWMKLDAHPPVYYLSLHPFLLLFGTGYGAARLFPALLGCLTLVAIPFVGRDLGLGKRGVLFGLFLLAVSSLHIYYSQETRMYTMLALQSLLATATFYLAVTRGRFRDWLFYVLITILSLYTHVYAFFLLPGPGLYLLVVCLTRRLPWRTLMHFLLALLVMAVLLAPLLPTLRMWSGYIVGGARMATPVDVLRAWEVWGVGLTALPTPGLDLLVNPPLQWGGPLLLAGLCLLAVWPARSWRNKQLPALPLLGLMTVFSVILPVLVSITLRLPIWADKALSMAAPVVYLLAGAGAARLPLPRLRIALALVFLTISALNLYPHYFVRVKTLAPLLFAQLRERAQPGDLLVLDPFWNVYISDFYYPDGIYSLGYLTAEQKGYFFEIAEGPKHTYVLEDPVALRTASRVWLWGPSGDITDFCRYNARAEYWYFDSQVRAWQQAPACPGP